MKDTDEEQAERRRQLSHQTRAPCWFGADEAGRWLSVVAQSATFADSSLDARLSVRPPSNSLSWLKPNEERLLMSF